MESKIYIVALIEGDYATLSCVEDDSELFIALALLPPGTDTGTTLLFENFEYTMI